jgi:hypothetical protein
MEFCINRTTSVDLTLEYPGWINLNRNDMRDLYQTADIVVIVHERDDSSNVRRWWNDAKTRTRPDTPVYVICRSFIYRQTMIHDIEYPGGSRAGYKIASTESDFNWVLRNICSRYVAKKHKPAVTQSTLLAKTEYPPSSNSPPPFLFFDQISSEDLVEEDAEMSDGKSDEKESTGCNCIIQ